MAQPPYLPGTGDTPGIPIGSSTSGICQLEPHTFSFTNDYRGTQEPEDHKFVHVFDDMGLQFGALTPGRYTTASTAIEINHLNAEAAAVPQTFGAWVADDTNFPAWKFFRSRGASPGVGGAVVAGDELGRLEWRGDMGEGHATANVACRIIARVGAGWTDPGSGTYRVGGEIAFQTARGDGIADLADRLVITRDGHFNVVSGTLYVASVITAIAPGGGVQVKPNFRNFRSLIPDDGVVAVPIPQLGSAIVAFLSEDTAGLAAPVGQVAVNAGAVAAPELIASIGTAGITLGTGVPTGTTGSDGTLNLRNAGDGNLYLENRLGGPRTYSVHIING